jgi:hypothetical protein
MFFRTDQQVEEALKIISTGNDKEPEYLNFEPANRVLEKFGYPTKDLPR